MGGFIPKKLKTKNIVPTLEISFLFDVEEEIRSSTSPPNTYLLADDFSCQQQEGKLSEGLK